MDSNYMLVNAASGLEQMMSTPQTGILKSSIVAQVSAMLYYKAHVMNDVMNNNAFKKKFNDIIFKQLEKDFGEYIDAKARISPKSLHHVYEWKMTGNQSGRLFKIKRKNLDGLSFNIEYDFLTSKKFIAGKNRRYVFKDKARVMERGEPLVVAPRYSQRLVFDINGYTVYMPIGKSVTIKKPGGAAVKKSFEIAYSYFFKSNLVNLSIKKSGFQNIFNSAMAKALSLPADIKKVKYTFSPNTIRTQASAAVSAAFGG